MIRAILYLLLSIFLITFIRLVIGIVMKGLNAYLNPVPPTTASKGAPTSTATPKSGVLRKDSHSGVYIAEDSAIVKVINGQTHYFANEENFRAFLQQAGTRG
ncbi:MAG: hypothetical protein MUF01_13870 [Bryobacterales bacterium]|jgi:hypothetical protein|nr:hypothetical protein [Bryobacterales bacterium]